VSIKRERVSFGQVSGAVTSVKSLRGLVEDDPLSPAFKVPPGDSPKAIYLYFLATQSLQYGTTLPEKYPVYTKPIMLRHIVLLLRDFSPEQIKRGIKLASQRCRYPFSMRLVRHFINTYDLKGTDDGTRIRSG
jgi:hypothetical protein